MYVYIYVQEYVSIRTQGPYDTADEIKIRIGVLLYQCE